MLLVANLAHEKGCKKAEIRLKLWHICTHLRVLRESYPMNTNTTGFTCFKKKYVCPCALAKLGLYNNVNLEVCDELVGNYGH